MFLRMQVLLNSFGASLPRVEPLLQDMLMYILSNTISKASDEHKQSADAAIQMRLCHAHMLIWEYDRLIRSLFDICVVLITKSDRPSNTMIGHLRTVNQESRNESPATNGNLLDWIMIWLTKIIGLLDCDNRNSIAFREVFLIKPIIQNILSWIREKHTQDHKVLIESRLYQNFNQRWQTLLCNTAFTDILLMPSKIPRDAILRIQQQLKQSAQNLSFGSYRTLETILQNIYHLPINKDNKFAVLFRKFLTFYIINVCLSLSETVNLEANLLHFVVRLLCFPTLPLVSFDQEELLPFYQPKEVRELLLTLTEAQKARIMRVMIGHVIERTEVGETFSAELDNALQQIYDKEHTPDHEFGRLLVNCTGDVLSTNPQFIKGFPCLILK